MGVVPLDSDGSAIERGPVHLALPAETQRGIDPAGLVRVLDSYLIARSKDAVHADDLSPVITIIFGGSEAARRSAHRADAGTLLGDGRQRKGVRSARMRKIDQRPRTLPL
jgi:hypothetical protein